MPRKKQVVQKQRRRKLYQAGELSADFQSIKPKGAFRVFTNYRLFAIIGAVVLIGGFAISAIYRGGTSSSSSSTSVRGKDSVIRTTPEAGSTAAPGQAIKHYTAPPALTIDPAKTYTATIKTEQGDVRLELLPKEAPAAVNNFVFLARDGFYNGVTFHRVISDFVAQAGDPTGTGSGGPGYDLPVENTAGSFTAGVLAMARPPQAGSLNNGSQFFITLKDEPTLDGKFTAFGRVVDGLDILKSFPPRDPQLQQNPDPGPVITAGISRTVAPSRVESRELFSCGQWVGCATAWPPRGGYLQIPKLQRGGQAVRTR